MSRSHDAKQRSRGSGEVARRRPGASPEVDPGRRALEASPGGPEGCLVVPASTGAGTPPAPSPGTSSARAPVSAPPSARRRRTGLKRTKFQVPTKVPAPVRALWRSATVEERERAHRTATTVLMTWLGRLGREEAARDLGLTRLRFWQLSQQAVAGLVAGCLRQPRFRGRVDLSPEEPPVGELKRRIRSLEREVEAGRRLIGVLRDLPGSREAKGRPPREARHGASGRERVEDDAGTAPGGGREAGGASGG